MAIRNSWLVPIAVLIMIAVLAIVLFGDYEIKPGLTPDQPGTAVLQVPARYRTIQAAIDAAKAGDIVQVAPGTYRENVTLNKPVVLIAARLDEQNPANNSTVLDGGNGRAALLIPAGLADKPSLQGFVVRNSQYGIEAHSEFDLEHDYFYGSQISVSYEAGSGGVNRNNVYFNSSDDAVHVELIGLPLLIEGNRFLYAGDDAIELDFAPADASLEVDILNNILAGSSQDGIKLVDYGSGAESANRRVVAAGNLIANNRRAGIGFVHGGNTNEDFSGADTTEPVRIYNNTFYGNNYGISGGGNLVAFNNIIADTASRGAWRVQGPPDANSVIAYTLFWNNAVDSDQSTLGQGDILGQDPLFVAEPGPGPDGAWGTVDDAFGGLLLRPDSPAIDRGVAQYTLGNGERVPSDPLTGFTGAAPDLGWREASNAVRRTPTTAPPTPASVATATSAATATATPKAVPTSRKTNDTPTAPAATATQGSPTASPTALPATPTASQTPTAQLPTAATPQMSIESIAPSTAANYETVTLTINGSGFQQGAAVAFEGAEGTPPRVYAVQVLDQATIIATVEAVNTTTGEQTWDVRVSNLDGSSALLEQAFSVTP